MTTLKEAMKQAKATGKRVKVTETTPITEIKVNLSIRLDLEVLNWIKDEAKLKGLPYQTLINSILTQVKNAGTVEDRLARLEKLLKEEKSA